MPAELEQQLPAFARTIDRDAPTITASEVVRRGVVSIEMEWPPRRSSHSQRSRRHVLGAAAVLIALLVGGLVVLTRTRDESPAPADTVPAEPAPVVSSTPTRPTAPEPTLPSTTTASVAPQSVPEDPEPTDAPALSPEAVRQAFDNAAGDPNLGALCGPDSCTISDIRTRDDSVVLTVQLNENRSTDALPDQGLAESIGRQAFGILGEQFPQLEYIQVTNTTGLVLADVKCYEAFPSLPRCP